MAEAAKTDVGDPTQGVNVILPATTKTRRVYKTFLQGDGSETKLPTGGTQGVRFAIVGHADAIDVMFSDLSESVNRQAAAFGISEAGGNAAGAVGKDGTVADSVDNLQSRIETWKGDEWRHARESEGAPSRKTLEAVLRVWIAGKKAQADQDELAARVNAYDAAERKEWNKKAGANPAVKAELAKMRLEALGKIGAEAKGGAMDL